MDSNPKNNNQKNTLNLTKYRRTSSEIVCEAKGFLNIGKKIFFYNVGGQEQQEEKN